MKFPLFAICFIAIWLMCLTWRVNTIETQSHKTVELMYFENSNSVLQMECIKGLQTNVWMMWEIQKLKLP